MEITFLVSPTKLHKELLSVGKDLCLNFLQSPHSQTSQGDEQLYIVKSKVEMEMVSSKAPKTQQTNNSSDLKFDVDFAFQTAMQTTENSCFLTVLLLETSAQN